MIHSVLEGKMRSAIELDENKNKDGSINWNFVVSDCYMDCANLFKDSETFYESFNSIADTIIKERESASNEIQLEMEV